LRRIVVIGHSHILALRQAWVRGGAGGGVDLRFVLLRDPALRRPKPAGMSELQHKGLTSRVEGIDAAALAQRIAQAAADVAVLCLNGDEYAALALFQARTVDHARKVEQLAAQIPERLGPWLDLLLPLLPPEVLFYTAPPPVAADALEGSFAPERITAFAGRSLEPPAFRMRLWQQQCSILRQLCTARGITFVDPPSRVFDPDGLARDCWSDEPMHANAVYGQHMIEQLLDVAGAAPDPRRGAPSVRISRRDRIASAGGGFAQQIAERLHGAGFRLLAPEAGLDGAIATARQLRQLFDRAYGYYRPLDRVLARRDGGFCDPFRPDAEPGGFATEAEVEAATRRHLVAVRRLFERLDVLVVTLDRTACWISPLDGAALPPTPGSAPDPARQVFVQFAVAEVMADLEAFLAKLRLVNPRARLVLALAGAGSHAQSVLRVAAEEIGRLHPDRFCAFLADNNDEAALRLFMDRMTDAAAGA
jgi:hypothetical protein